MVRLKKWDGGIQVALQMAAKAAPTVMMRTHGADGRPEKGGSGVVNKHLSAPLFENLGRGEAVFQKGVRMEPAVQWPKFRNRLLVNSTIQAGATEISTRGF